MHAKLMAVFEDEQRKNYASAKGMKNRLAGVQFGEGTHPSEDPPG